MGIVCRVFSGTTGINVMNYHHILIAKLVVVDLQLNVTFLILLHFTITKGIQTSAQMLKTRLQSTRYNNKNKRYICSQLD